MLERNLTDHLLTSKLLQSKWTIVTHGRQVPRSRPRLHDAPSKSWLDLFRDVLASRADDVSQYEQAPYRLRKFYRKLAAYRKDRKLGQCIHGIRTT
jgi:hypothetical protein